MSSMYILLFFFLCLFTVLQKHKIYIESVTARGQGGKMFYLLAVIAVFDLYWILRLAFTRLICFWLPR